MCAPVAGKSEEGVGNTLTTKLVTLLEVCCRREGAEVVVQPPEKES